MTMQLPYVVAMPAQTVRQIFDFTAFAAAVSPQVVTYQGHGDLGPTYTEVSNVGGLITLDLSSSDLGRVFEFGYTATTPDGQQETDLRRLRIRQPVDVSAIPVTLDLAFLTELGDVLVTENGDVLSFA